MKRIIIAIVIVGSSLANNTPALLADAIEAPANDLASKFEGYLWSIRFGKRTGNFPEEIPTFIILQFGKRKGVSNEGEVEIGTFSKNRFSTERTTWAGQGSNICVQSKPTPYCMSFSQPSSHWNARYLGFLTGTSGANFMASIEAVRLDFDLANVIHARGKVYVGPVEMELPAIDGLELDELKIEPYKRGIVVGWSAENKFGVGVRWNLMLASAADFVDTWTKVSVELRRQLESIPDMEIIALSDFKLLRASCIRMTGVHGKDLFRASQFCLVEQEEALYLAELNVIEKPGKDFRSFRIKAEKILATFSVRAKRGPED